MAIRRKSLDTYAGLKGLASRDDSVLADKISRLIIWYSLQKRDLSDEDRNYLDTSLVECYRRYGITFDNTSVLHEDGSFREMPVLADWYDVLQESADTRHLAVVLARYVTGSASAMGSRNEIDLDNKYIVIDTSGMPDDLLLPGIFWATDIANDLISGAGGQLSALISDELWSLVGANSNPLGRLHSGDGQDDPRPRRYCHHIYVGYAGPVLTGQRQIRQRHSGFQPHQDRHADGGTGSAAGSKRLEFIRGRSPSDHTVPPRRRASLHRV